MTGVVHWQPPQSALDAAARVLQDPATSQYGPCDGLPQLVQALEAKVEAENSLSQVQTHTTVPLSTLHNRTSSSMWTLAIYPPKHPSELVASNFLEMHWTRRLSSCITAIELFCWATDRIDILLAFEPQLIMLPVLYKEISSAAQDHGDGWSQPGVCERGAVAAGRG